MMSRSYEKKFLDRLQDIFVGAKVEGKSGYVNLLNIKTSYYEDIKIELMKFVDSQLNDFPDFREELFDKMYSFFSRYFTENGSLYFNDTPFHKSIYEKIYTDEKDIILFYKTNMLYYVKSDVIIKNVKLEVDEFNFFFNAEELVHKKNNEKKELVFDFSSIYKENNSNVIELTVSYSEKGKKTKIENILKLINKTLPDVTEDVVKRAIAIFSKQSTFDYFINKNAKNFLEEQFDLWFYQYIFKESNAFSVNRIKQLQILKDIAYKIIAFISQFEDELNKVWNKPKFVLSSNYVITMDKLNKELKELILKSEGIIEQINEWKNFEIVPQNFEIHNIFEPSYKYLPIDTKYFKDVENKILEQFDNLDSQLDGWLIHSENYQALNTILPKFKERVQAIYIDPPFNKETDADYHYSVKYKDSTWLTMLENRLQLAKKFLSPTGSIFLRCDYNGNAIVRLLMDNIFEKRNFINELSVNRTKKIFAGVKGYNVATDSLFFYANNADKMFFEPQYKIREKGQKWINAHSPGERRPPERIIDGVTYFPPKGRHFTFKQETLDRMISEGRIRINTEMTYIDMNGKEVVGMPQYQTDKFELLDSNWIDIPGYSSTQGFSTENSEVLLKRVINSATSDSGEDRDIVMDFFLGSGTTIAVAQKLKRKWIGIEMGDHFYTVILRRMKRILSGKKENISSDKDVEYEGSGFFKYFELEQYEDTLRNSIYSNDKLTIFNTNENQFEQYVFMRDEKMSHCLNLEMEQDEILVNLSNLYQDIDVAETLSCLQGKFIKYIDGKKVIYTDGSTVNVDSPNYQDIRPLIWWC